MNARRRSTISGPSNDPDSRRKTPTAVSRDEGEKEKLVQDDSVERERAILVQQRQTELDNVFNTHDTLVREAFHLEKFVTLLSYDPKVAKDDNSAVFKEYQGRYDLIDHSSSVGLSRQTRRSHTERLQSLKHSSNAHSTPQSGRIRTASAAGKQKADMPPPGLPASSSTNGSRKGKEKAKALENPESPPSRTGKRGGETAGPLGAQPPNKKRRLSNGHIPNSPESISAISRRAPASDRTRESPWHRPLEPSSHVKSTVRRIKLIVRRPDPVYSSPLQRPPLPRYGESLSDFLSSFAVLDGKELDATELQELARKEAAFLNRVDRLHKEGRFFPTSRSDDTVGRSRSPSDLYDQHEDPWAHVLDAVKAKALHRPLTGHQVAAQVASRMRAYWESRAVKEDKIKVQEEKRLRALAKATVKMVVAEWKKAVYHVRQEERLKREEEERRRGHEHLDAILDQSGQILEAQQLELTKAASYSRSSSVSTTFGHWAASPEPDDASSDGGEGVENDEETEAEDDEGADENVQDVDASLLLVGGSEFHFDEDSRSISMDISTSRSASVSQPPDTPLPVELDDVDVHSEAVSSRALSVEFAIPEGHYRNFSTSIREEDERPKTSTYREEESSTVFALSPTSPGFSTIVNDAAYTNGYSKLGRANESLFRAAPDDALEPTTKSFANEPTGQLNQTLTASAASGGTLTALTSKEEVSTSTLSVNSSADVVDYKVPLDGAFDDRTVDRDVTRDSDMEEDVSIPSYLRPFAVTPVEWDSDSKIKTPFLLRGTLRPYQFTGLEWLATLHSNNLNGILADEMGLGKTIQTISLLAHLACDRGIWGPHLIIVPTSVLLNWEMEFKKFLPGFKVLSYHGNTKRRKELRQGWNNKYHFNVCVTSYTLASRDAHVFKRKAWYYMILDEAHMIKNFKSQRWNTLLMFRSFRRLLLTGTPLQNNLTELWALLQFLMSGTNFANLKEFGEWFSNPLEKAIEMGTMDDETQQRVTKLHTVLRPYLLRRLKRDVEKELPQKFEHLLMCPLSKRQRFLYDEFMARAETRHDLQSGVYQKVANILMQLRKVVNHPDLFEVRPIVTSFAMERSAIANYEIKEFLVRRDLLRCRDEDKPNLDLLGLQFIQQQNTSKIAAEEMRRLDGTQHLPMITELPGEPPPHDTRTIAGYKRFRAWQQRAAQIARWSHIAYLNRLRIGREPLYSQELFEATNRFYEPLLPLSNMDMRRWDSVEAIPRMIKSYIERADEMASVIDRFTFVTPAVIARDMPAITLAGHEGEVYRMQSKPEFDGVLHRASVKLQIAFPDPSLLQYDCGKLQELAYLLRERKAGGHRILIFTQMTRILDILEVFLNFHGYLYLRLDGATKIEDRQYITERFNSDPRIFCFISSSRSGGVGINLTGADTVIFYDSDFNPQMDRQCEDRAHRIGQIRDVHIYRFVSEHTVEEALLRKANQKRSLDDIVIQRGEFDWRTLFTDETALTKALGEFEDSEDAHAAAVAAKEEVAMVGADEADFGVEGGGDGAIPDTLHTEEPEATTAATNGDLQLPPPITAADDETQVTEDEENEEEGGTIVDYMLAVVRSDSDFFGDWRL
ncbi:uncharacterized protein LAESUDRAFT_728619 [Laetiporus sulphureus 93-53]|uniref:DNA helicase n=1 Tax=Laetiporus sulphureus 93-53 TaxID=1314785 RepID=A0A165D126_9APHY|nr:uncharacterized protein LAESUDRAFT_728619 [Laetiporus sulphureus 93-53]KZT03925.1 hypothetical protein LAESUDRAFT_728619 [Laetiporus sulphureus 93-53]